MAQIDFPICSEVTGAPIRRFRLALFAEFVTLSLQALLRLKFLRSYLNGGSPTLIPRLWFQDSMPWCLTLTMPKYLKPRARTRILIEAIFCLRVWDVGFGLRARACLV